MKSQKGKFIVIVGPSASGKTKLVTELLKKIPGSARLITTTTRERRPGEKDDYFFISRPEFEKGIAGDTFFEYADVYGNYYGSSRTVLEEFLAKYKYVFAIIDVQGAKTLKTKIKDAVIIFVNPGSTEEINRRLTSERAETSKDELQKRMETVKAELALAPTFDYVVENREGHFEEAVADALKIILV